MDQLPRYKYIYEALRRRIADGVYAAGDLLPSENELCAAYEVTRPTVRKALELLATDGFIIRHQGKGSIVKGFPKGIGILSLSGTTSAVGETEMQTTIIVRPEVREWDEALTFPISPAEKEAGCIYFERLRILGGVPVILDITMLPNIGLPDFVSRDLGNASLFDLLRTQYGIVVTGGIQQLYAIGADKRLRSHLRIRQGYPILQLNRKIETTREGFYIYSQVFCVTNNYSLTGTF